MGIKRWDLDKIMKFKDNPLKFMRREKRLKMSGVWGWVSIFHNDRNYVFTMSHTEEKIRALSNAVSFYDRYIAVRAQYRTLRKLYRKYRGTNIGWD